MLGRFIEYLKLVPKGIKNADKILEGIINNVKLEAGSLPEEEQAEIIRRRLICATCPFTSSNAVVNKALNYKTDRPDEHCIHCGCPIMTKTASLSANCGIEIFNAKNPETPMPLKWTAYKTNDDEHTTAS